MNELISFNTTNTARKALNRPSFLASISVLLTTLFLGGCEHIAAWIPPLATDQKTEQSAEQAPKEPPVECKCESEKTTTPAAEEKADYTLLGEIERVRIEPGNLTLTARIDTGATTSSLDAQNITQFERDGKPWVRFHMIDPTTGEHTEVSRRIVRKVPIKGKGIEIDIRPVVKMQATIGDIKQRIEFTLSNRSRYKYPVLIGRNFLRDVAIVDVSKRYVTKIADTSKAK